MKKFHIILAVIVLFLAAGVISWFGFFQNSITPGVIIHPDATNSVEAQKKSVPLQVEEVASGLAVPWNIVFTSPERILVTERPGRIRVIQKGVLQKEPLHVFSEVSTTGEEGLMGLTLDPKYSENKLLYLALAYQTGEKMEVKILRFQDQGTKLGEEKVILDHIPAAHYHAGCALAFGPDGKLYITTGDSTQRNLAQDLSSLAGKVLRLNPDGRIPDDNPFPQSPVWSYGHRNSQGIFWHPQNGELYEVEHGPSGFDGPGGGDEINRIVKGGNYGWPLVSHEETKAGTISPLHVFTPAEAPSSLLIYSGDIIPQFTNDLFFGALKGEGLVRLSIDPQNPDRITTIEKLADVHFGRIRAVTEGPDGFIYFSTSNRDGRGTPAKNDDRIFRIRPEGK